MPVMLNVECHIDKFGLIPKLLQILVNNQFPICCYLWSTV